MHNKTPPCSPPPDNQDECGADIDDWIKEEKYRIRTGYYSYLRERDQNRYETEAPDGTMKYYFHNRNC